MKPLTLILGFALTSVLPLTQAKEITGIAAKVNGRVVTKNELNFHLTPIREQVSAAMPRKGPQYYTILKDARKKILNDLIERELILSEYQHLTNGNGIPQAAIDSEINRQVAENFNNNRSEFNKALRNAGLTPEQNRREMEKKLIVQAMRAQQFKNSAPPLPDEVSKEYYKQKNKLRDKTGDALEYHKIYIPKRDRLNPVASPESQLSLAEDIVKKLKKGADFEKLAKEHSADSYAADGGKVEKTPRTDLTPSFATILMETPTKKIIGPLEDPNGYTIVRLDKKHYGPAPSLSKVRKQMEGRVKAEKNKAKLDRWIKRIRGNAMIEIK